MIRMSYPVAVIAEEAEGLYAELYREPAADRREAIETRLDELEVEFRLQVGLA